MDLDTAILLDAVCLACKGSEVIQLTFYSTFVLYPQRGRRDGW